MDFLGNEIWYITLYFQFLILKSRHPRYNNYCSKCYNELLEKNEIQPNETQSISSVSHPISINNGKKYNIQDSHPLNVSSSVPYDSTYGSISQGTSPSSYQDISLGKKLRKVCAAEGCKKKLSLTSVECKCGKAFCSSHRYAEQHNCTYDYKKNKEDLLNKTNPIVAPSKITEI